VTKPLRVLLIEDIEDEALLLRYELERHGYAPLCQRVETAETVEAALRQQTWDVVLCDYNMPQFGPAASIDLLKALDLDIPLIIVSGTVGEEVAVSAMKAGAHDFVMKDKLTRLVPAIQRELREAKIRQQRRRALEELRASEERYRLLFEQNVSGILRSTLEGQVLDCNEAFAGILGYASREEIKAHSSWDCYFSRADRERLLAGLQEQGTLVSHEICLRRKDGAPVHVLANVSLLDGDNGQAVIHGTIVDITERKQAERRMEVGRTVAGILAQSATLAEAAPGILQIICSNLSWDLGILWLVDRHAEVLRCVDVWHTLAVGTPAIVQASRQHTFSPEIGLPGRVWSSDHPTWIPDVTRDSNFPRAESAAQDGLHAAVGFPVGTGAEFLGVLEFFSREIRQPDEALLQMMSGIGRQISRFLERRQADERARELDLARKIQRGLLPRAMPALPGFAMSGASCPAQEVGGDYFDFLMMGDESLGIALGDAVGHGIAAALLMAETCAYIRALALTHTDVDRILTLANHRLVEDIAEHHFVTLLLARLDPRTRCLVYSSAGHCQGYVLDSEGKVKTILSSTGMPLGLDLAAAFPSSPPIALEPGDLIFFFTDGVVETPSADGNRFGPQRALETVGAHRQEAPRQILEALFQTISDFSRNRQLDDMTAVIIKVEGSAEQGTCKLTRPNR
jgi:PAS domain S-box-containing protein